MSAHADEIRDAEILDLQRQVTDLQRRVRELERRPVFVPYTPPCSPCPMPAYPVDLPHRRPWRYWANVDWQDYYQNCKR